MRDRELQVLRSVSAPARLFAGAELAGACWPLAHRMLTLWQGKHQESLLPAWSHISARDMGEFMPWMTVCNIVWDPFRLTVRLVGTKFAEAVGFDPTGQEVAAVSNTQQVMERSEWVATYREPLLVTDLPLVWSQKDFKHYDSLLLPFSEHGENADILLFLNRFYR